MPDNYHPLYDRDEEITHLATFECVLQRHYENILRGQLPEVMENRLCFAVYGRMRRRSEAMIKTIALDLGGVYFTRGTRAALKKIYKLVDVPKEKVDEIFEGYPGKEGLLYRQGKLTKEEFWQAAVKKLKISQKQAPILREIWHSSYKPIKGMKRLVSKLRKKYRLIAFSGNIRERIEYLDKKYSLRRDFDDLLLSFDVGFTKSQLEFYKILVKRINCKPEECLFIDDHPEFLDIAGSLGIRTILFKSPRQLEIDFKNFA